MLTIRNETRKDADLIYAAENPLPPISIADACVKYGIERKLLMGRLMRNGLRDPITVSGKVDDIETILIADDWRLQDLSTVSKSS
jgi:hypothetical protein